MEILFLMLLVSIIYSIGSIFDLFVSDLEYDGFLHFYSGFILAYLFGSLIKQRIKVLSKNKFILCLTIIFFGLGVSIIWEIFEFYAGKFLPEYIIGDLTDIFSDLTFDSLGILLATVFIFKKGF